VGGDLVGEEFADDLVVLAALDVRGEEIGKHVVELASRQPARAICVVFPHNRNQVLESPGDRGLVFWNAKEIDDGVWVLFHPEIYKSKELQERYFALNGIDHKKDARCPLTSAKSSAPLWSTST
jgi:hypothetical protein